MRLSNMLKKIVILLVFGIIAAGCGGGGGGGTAPVGDAIVKPGGGTPVDGDGGSVLLSTYFRDADNDGFGDQFQSIETEIAPAGYVENSQDCDDANPAVNPDAVEVCGDGIDNNCDGLFAECPRWWFADADGDGFGDPAASVYDTVQPAGYVENSADCGDTDPSVYPGATEVPYDGVDQDCDGSDLTDVDGDGHDAIVAGGDDCNDNDGSIYPGAVDIIGNGIDENCDGHDMTMILNSALREGLARFDRVSNQGYTWPSTLRSHAMLYLTEKALDGYADAEARLFQHIDSLLQPGNEPDVTGSLNERGHVAVISSFALLKANPWIWQKLTAEQRAKIRLIIKAELVACATTTSDKYDFGTGLDGLGNYKKTWNPNYREASVGTLIAATLFFGADKAQSLLDAFDCETFIDEAAAAGLPTIVALFTYTGSGDISYSKIEDAIRGYTYNDRPLSNPVGIYSAPNLSRYTFGEYITCAVSDGGAWAGLIEGCDGLPDIGAQGMLKEFNAVDGAGLRSSLSYSALGWSHNTVTAFLLNYFGYTISAAVAGLREVGTADLFYKAEHGYRSYALGESRIEYESNLTFGFKYVKKIWEEALK